MIFDEQMWEMMMMVIMMKKVEKNIKEKSLLKKQKQINCKSFYFICIMMAMAMQTKKKQKHFTANQFSLCFGSQR